MDDTAHYSAQKICHAYNPRLDKSDKFVKMSFSTKWTEVRKYIMDDTAQCIF